MPQSQQKLNKIECNIILHFKSVLYTTFKMKFKKKSSKIVNCCKATRVIWLYLFLVSIQIQKISSCKVYFNTCYKFMRYCSDTQISEYGNKNFESLDDLHIRGTTQNNLAYNLRITFTNCSINTISNNILTTYKTLKYLYLNDSHVATIESEAFRGLGFMETLYLQNNEIMSLKLGTFKDLQSLKTLNISHNYLSSLEDDLFAGLYNLEILDISYNNLTNINTKLFKTNQLLIELYLNNNNIDIIDGNFQLYRAFHLKILNLGNNHLNTSITTQLNNLEKLILSHNIISAEYVEFGATIIYLDISFTMLHLSIYSFKNCDELNELFLNNNNIFDIDVNLFETLAELKNLQLQHNNIKEISVGSFRNLHHLQILNLSYNQLDHLESGVINCLENLLILSLSNNKLINLEMQEFNYLPHIQNINLDSNLLTTLNITNILQHIQPTQISLHNNFWKCSWLPNATKLLQKNNFIVLRGNSFKVKNFEGITCIDDTYYTTDCNKLPIEEIWQSINKIMNILIFIVIFIVSVVIIAIIYFIKVKFTKKYKEIIVNHTTDSHSCNVELMNSNNE